MEDNRSNLISCWWRTLTTCGFLFIFSKTKLLFDLSFFLWQLQEGDVAVKCGAASLELVIFEVMYK